MTPAPNGTTADDSTITPTNSEPLNATSVRRCLPSVVSAALVGWLVWRVSSLDLARAIADLDWRLLAPLTAVLVVALFLWDAVCVRFLFAVPGRALDYRTVLRARGASYLVGAVNYGLGQGTLAWMLAKEQGMSFVSGLSRLALLAYHDMAVLFGLGLLASLASDDPQIKSARSFCAIGLVTLVAAAAFVGAMPTSWHERWRNSRWGAWIGSWTWQRSLYLGILRVVNFTLSIVFASVAVLLAGISASPRTLLTAVPLVQLTEGLPITVSGLGSRETILLYLLGAEQPERIIAFGLFWSFGLIAGRLIIGLVVLQG